MASDTTIAERIEAVQVAVDTYFADAHPSVNRVRTPIDSCLEAARSFMDSEFPFAEMWLSLAQESFTRAKEQIDQCGGPQNARVGPPF